MENQGKEELGDIPVDLGNLKPSLLSKLRAVVIIMVMNIVLGFDMCFPDFPSIIKALEQKSEETAIGYTLEYYIKNFRKTKLDHNSVNKFPMLVPENDLVGTAFENKSRLQFACQRCGLPLFELNIMHLHLSFSETNIEKLADKLIEYMTSGKNYKFK
ncbi:hypothetical protein OCU04_004179 [Sclerotinia nivalis]|uniref:Uncharacterized protein n=1 Tax=Sclerotinia nivalis TaxID=352851 RepID=A0A9X0APX8_9HELO|nr:hypothetical protein OCU04_004179 [Sclerotinia nivalis]